MSAPTLCPSPALPRELLQLQEAIDAVGLFLAAGGDGSVATMTALLANAQQVDGLALRQVAQVDLAGSWIEVDSYGVHNIIKAALGCTDTSARATVRLARRLDEDLRPVGDLLREGRITRAHAAAIVYGVRGLDPDIIASSLEALCAAALATDPVRLGAVLRERAEAISDTLAQEQRRTLDARTHLTLDETPSGAWLLSGLLNAEAGALLNDVLDKRIAADRFDGDTAATPSVATTSYSRCSVTTPAAPTPTPTCHARAATAPRSSSSPAPTPWPAPKARSPPPARHRQRPAVPQPTDAPDVRRRHQHRDLVDRRRTGRLRTHHPHRHPRAVDGLVRP